MKRRFKKGFLDAIVLATVAGIILGVGWAMARAYDTRKAYTPTNLIRLHIIGNSDSAEDQEVKSRVRDSIVDTFGGYLMQAEDSVHAESIIEGSFCPKSNVLQPNAWLSRVWTMGPRPNWGLSFTPTGTTRTRQENQCSYPQVFTSRYK